MSAATADRNTPVQGAGGVPTLNTYPVAASTTILKGIQVCLDASGNLVAASDTAGLSTVVGLSVEHIDNSSGNAGDLSCNVMEGVCRWVNGNSMTKANVGALCYVADNQTVKSSGTVHAIIAGTVYLVDANGVWVYSGLQAPLDAAALTTYIADVASVANGEGASLVGVEDAGSLLTATTVEAALAEIVKKANAALSSPLCMSVYLSSLASATPFTFVAPTAGKISKIDACVRKAASTTAAATVQATVSGTAVSGGVLTLTQATAATLGARIAGSTITGTNSFTAGQQITLLPAVTTAFTEGELEILVFFASA